jgi:hypothetical protein
LQNRQTGVFWKFGVGCRALAKIKRRTAVGLDAAHVTTIRAQTGVFAILVTLLIRHDYRIALPCRPELTYVVLACFLCALCGFSSRTLRSRALKREDREEFAEFAKDFDANWPDPLNRPPPWVKIGAMTLTP